MNAYQPSRAPSYVYDSTYASFQGARTQIFSYDSSANIPPNSFEISPRHVPSFRQFTGKERDAESGLDYFEARYYGSALGRFTSPDPEQAGSDPGDPQSWNGYAYVTNNPLANIDPDGLAGEKPCNPPNCWSTTVSAVADTIAVETFSLLYRSVAPTVHVEQKAFDWASQPRNGNCLAASTAAGASIGAGYGLFGLAGGPAVGITEPTAMGIGGGLGWAGGMVSCMSSNGGTANEGNGGGRGGGGDNPRLTKPQQRQTAKHLGMKEVKGLTSQGQPVFEKNGRYFSFSNTNHTAGEVFKELDRNGNRIATTDLDFNRIGR